MNHLGASLFVGIVVVALGVVVVRQAPTRLKPQQNITAVRMTVFPSPTDEKTVIPTNTPEATTTPTLTPTPTESPTPTSTTKPTPTPTRINIPAPTVIPTTTTMPGDGLNRIRVTADGRTYSVTCIGATQGAVKVVTDSANDSDCTNNCPVMPLGDFVKRNSGFAGINGMYFCPADYASCAGKTNSFDTLFFNSRYKRYLNVANNVYSVIPFLVIGNDGSPQFISRSLEWGKDGGIQAGTAGNPLLIKNGNFAYDINSLSDKQKNTKSNVGAFVQKGNHIYLCIASNATVVDSAKIYKVLNADNAINIDGGGSSALWFNGSYIFGPGRSIPTAIIFTR